MHSGYAAETKTTETTMAETVYVLCALTSVICALLLVRSWKRSRARILLWSSLCFVGLAANNILLLTDLVFIPDVDLSIVRATTALGAVAVLVIGLIWERR
jgi:hydrogenase/urease accessory protein HupE